MDPNENTKSEPGQNHNSPGPQDSARQPEEPGDTQVESPRRCKICGGPNHYGCGCEAKAREEKHRLNALPTIHYRKDQLQPVCSAGKAGEKIRCSDDIYEVTCPECLGIYDEKPTPAEQEQPIDTMIENVLKRWSEKDIAEILEGSFDVTKDIKTMADGFEGLCACMYDTNNYLKLIASDMITIRKLLSKEDEVKNANENKN